MITGTASCWQGSLEINVNDSSS